VPRFARLELRESVGRWTPLPATFNKLESIVAHHRDASGGGPVWHAGPPFLPVAPTHFLHQAVLFPRIIGVFRI